MALWFLSYEGKQIGPFDFPEASRRARENRKGFAWREGFVEWLPLPQVAELLQDSPKAPQPPPLVQRGADEIDFRIVGSEVQFVEVELDPKESVLSDPGHLVYKSPRIVLGAPGPSGDGGVLFTHTGTGKAHVAFAPSFSGRILPVTLKSIGGAIVCQELSFLCAARGVTSAPMIRRRIQPELYGADGFALLRIEGDGMAFLAAGGVVIERNLHHGEILHVDPSTIVGLQPSVVCQIEDVSGVQSRLLGGVALSIAALTGPGRIWLQSLPVARVVGRASAGRAP